MPARYSKAPRPISFTDFKGHSAERFSNNRTDAAFELWKLLGRSGTPRDFETIFHEACDVVRVRFDATVDTVDTRRAGLNYAFDDAAATYSPNVTGGTDVMPPLSTAAILQELKDKRKWLNWNKERRDASMGLWVSFSCGGPGL